MILSSFLLEILSLLNLCFDIASKRILCCPLIGHRIFRNRRDLPSFYGQLSARVLLQVRSEISTFLQKTVTYRPSGLMVKALDFGGSHISRDWEFESSLGRPMISNEASASRIF